VNEPFSEKITEMSLQRQRDFRGGQGCEEVLRKKTLPEKAGEIWHKSRGGENETSRKMGEAGMEG